LQFIGSPWKCLENSWNLAAKYEWLQSMIVNRKTLVWKPFVLGYCLRLEPAS